MRETTPDLTRISKCISLILRHKPEVIGIQLDAHGWADVNALLAGISKKYFIDRDILEEIVRSDSKQRYVFNEDRTRIRASQGHSVQVDVELPVVYLVDAGQMHRDGSLFYLSANGVWLTKTVPAPYLKRLEE